jgi:hypothetical protein
VTGAAELLSRSDQAERRERIEELEALEHRRALGDVDGLRLGCMAWFDRHALAGLGDAEGERQLARLLALFPDDRFGSWARDRRARIVKFLLDGRMAAVPPETVRRTLATLNGVPDPARARLELAAGNAAAARALADETGEPLAPEWGPYAIELAKREIAAGRLTEARRAIESLDAAGREGCEALLVRRDIARRQGDSTEAQAVEGRLAALRLPAAEDWSSRGALTLCVDPEWSQGQVLEVEIGPGSPALMSWGWNGARIGTLAVPAADGSLRAPLAGLEGQKTLWISFLVGGEGRSLHGLLRRAS